MKKRALSIRPQASSSLGNAAYIFPPTQTRIESGIILSKPSFVRLFIYILNC